MNPAGVSVFYGAFDPETCLAEIRLPVGGKAFTASFRLVRPITVLDLTVLDQGIHGVSWLDPDFDHVSEQSAFFDGFHGEISRPILEQEEDLEFVPTQVVAEYLAHRFKPLALDGVIYKSPQTGGAGLNIALFHHASGIKGTGTEVKSDTGPEVTFDGEGGVQIRNPRKAPERAPESERSPLLRPDVELEIWDPSREPDVEVIPTLEFVDHTLQFWTIRSTHQEPDSLNIFDFRKPSDLPDF